MTKKNAIALLLLFCLGFLWAETHLSISSGLSLSYASVGMDPLDGSMEMVSFSPAIGLDGVATIGDRAFAVFAGVEVAYPFVLETKNNYGTSSTFLDFSYTLSSELGLGLLLFRKSRFTLFLGAGVANLFVNYTDEDDGLAYSAFGAAVAAQARFRLAPSIGLFAGINFAYYPTAFFFTSTDETGSSDATDLFEYATGASARLGIDLSL
ncbi:MAG TPA: hypothetical protein PLU93_02215 [Treponemataceae bacterium]|jgi:hypothetical protein|nr:hypothetical protein [Treponemataceae bacterium]